MNESMVTRHYIENPSMPPVVTSQTNNTSTLEPTTYYVAYTWVSATGETVKSPTVALRVEKKKELVIQVPTLPANVMRANIYVSQISDPLLLQGFAVGGMFKISTPLVKSVSTPFQNNTARYVLPVSPPSGGEVLFFADASTAGTKGEFFIEGQQTLVLEIYGSATSAVANFFSKSASGIPRPITGVRLSDLSVGQSGGLTETWQFGITGLETFIVTLGAVAGGNVTVKGKAV